MLTRSEMLLVIFSEECSETAQRVSKAIRFSLLEKLKGQPFTNAELVNREFTDIMALHEMLVDEGVLPCPTREAFRTEVENKKCRVEQTLLYSQQCKTLEGEPP